MSGRRRLSLGERLVIAAPYFWIAAFFLAPMLLVAKISVSQSVLARPPYRPIFQLSDSFADLWAKAQTFTFDSYRALVSDTLYVESYLSSLTIAAVSTLITLIVAYPFALAIARAPERLRPLLIGLAAAPFWTSFLIRVYAWIALLKDEGLINNALMALGLISAPLQMYATTGAVVVGIVYSYLPFMLLPLYAALERQDPSLREAAADLGASPAQVFLRVTLPLSREGVVAGVAPRVHSRGRRIRHSRSPRRLRDADDRANFVERLLLQSRLAGRLRRGDRARRSVDGPAAGVGARTA